MTDAYPLPPQDGLYLVTPDMARDWFENHRPPQHEKSHLNRYYEDRDAEKWAAIMRDGGWHQNHPEGISFDWHQTLLDGQHRLSAIVKSGISVWMRIAINCDPATFGSINRGRVRQAAQFVEGPYRQVRAAAARHLAAFDPKYKKYASELVYANFLELELVLEVEAAWPELLEFAKPVSTVYGTARINRPMHLAVIAQAARTKHAARIGTWIEGLHKGENLVPNDPRLRLRNRYILDYRQLNSSAMRTFAYNLIAMPWDAHAEGRRIRSLPKYDPNDTPREVVPIVGYTRKDIR